MKSCALGVEVSGAEAFDLRFIHSSFPMNIPRNVLYPECGFLRESIFPHEGIDISIHDYAGPVADRHIAHCRSLKPNDSF